MLAERPIVFAANDLSVELGKTGILQDLTFSVARGSWVGLLGPNGSGKTTLLRALGGLLPYTGRLHLQDRQLNMWKDRERAQQIAFVRQHSSLDFDFTVREVVELGLAPHLNWLDQPSAEQREHIQDALADTDLLAFADRLVSTLSGGEQQRVQLAQALAQDASILLLDEPTAHLDVHHQYDLMERIRGLVQSGKTVIAAFHDLAFAARYTDQLVILDRGRLVADGTASEVLTSDLIRSVFRMEAEVSEESHAVQVRYLSPV